MTSETFSEKIRSHPLFRNLPLLFLAALVLTVSATFALGRRPLSPPLSMETREEHSPIRGGCLYFQPGEKLTIPLKADWAARDLRLEFRIRPQHIGILFFKFFSDRGDSESILQLDDFNPDNRAADIAVSLEHQSGMAMVLHEGDVVHWETLPPGELQSLVINAGYSFFAIDDLLIRDGATKNILFRESFGPDIDDPFSLTIVGLFCLAGLLLLFFAESFIGRFLSAISAERAAKTFFIGYLPFIFSLFVVDSLAWTQEVLLLAGATILWRLSLVLKPDSVGTTYLLRLAALLSVYPFFLLFADLHRWPAVVSAAMAVIVLGGLSAAEVLWWKKAGDLSWKAAFERTARPYLFTAFVLPVSFFHHDVSFPATLGAFSLPPLVIAKWGFLRSAGKTMKGSGLAILLCASALIASLEIVARHSDFSTRWSPEKLSIAYKSNRHLFWVPRAILPLDVEKIGPEKVGVESLKLRSGKATAKKMPGTYRILLLGGSNVWGDGHTDIEETWGKRLERLLNEKSGGGKYEVVNAGIPGYNLLQLYAFYKLFLADLEHDLVVVYVNMNEVKYYDEWGPYSLLETWDSYVPDDTGPFHETQGPGKPHWVSETQWGLRNFRLYNGLASIVLSHRIKNDPAGTPLKRLNPIEDYQTVLKRMTDLAKERGAKTLLVAEFMVNPSTGKPFPKDSPSDLYRRAMRETAESTGTPFCDAQELMSASAPDPRQLVFSWDLYHLNNDGTAELAQQISGCIDRYSLGAR